MFHAKKRLQTDTWAWFMICLSLSTVNTAKSQTSTVSADSTAKQVGGAVQGSVFYHADPDRRWRYQRFYIKDSKKGQLAEAVIVLTSRKRQRMKYTHESETVTIDQKNFQFTPETIAIQTGDRVKFMNSDKELHNVKMFHSFHSFNVNLPAGTEHVETFEKACHLRQPYHIGCVYHSAMRAWIFVFDHPYFQVTKTDGRFELTNIPPGNYKLEMVHPAGQLKWTEDIEVEAGKSANIDIHVSPDNLPKTES